MGVSKKRAKPVINYPPVSRRKWIPPDRRPKPPKPEPRYKKPEGISQKLSPSSLGKIWHDFRIIGHLGILTGNFSENSLRFTSKSNGHQSASVSVIACAFAHIYRNMAKWSKTYLDQIILLGNELHLKSLLQTSNRCLLDLTIYQVFNTFFFNHAKITLNIDKTGEKVQRISTICEEKIKEALYDLLDNFFSSFPSGVLCIGPLHHVAIWISNQIYYFFDACDHDCYGNRWHGLHGHGTSVLGRCKHLKHLVDYFYDNIDRNTKIFTITPCSVERIVHLDLTPPEDFDSLLPAKTEEILCELEEEEAVTTPKKKHHKKSKESIEEEVAESEAIPEPEEMEEISPDIGDDFSLSKRPSWFKEVSVVKKQCLEHQIPPEKPTAESLSFYNEILPNEISILRASTCQTDPAFSKYLGKQALGNAIAALAMCRIYKSKYWVPNTLDIILRKGDLLYFEAMSSIPRTKPLQITDFEVKFGMEGGLFQPQIEEYALIGKLQSQKNDVLDLLPALETFLTDNDCCILLGPIVLAIWVEDGQFYMFDPNERDLNGKAICKILQVGSNIVLVEHDKGVACVLCFKSLKKLVEVYMENLEKDRKWEDFCISKVQINDYVPIPEEWNEFQGIAPEKWIIRGNFSQSSRQFDRLNRNYQCTANTVMAIAFQQLKDIREWDDSTVDEVLLHGDKLYLETFNNLREHDKLIEKMFLLNELNTHYRINGMEARFTITDCLINGVINAKGQNDVLNLSRGLEEFFKDNITGAVTSHNTSVAIWKKDGVYYLFDSHSCDEKGLLTGFGRACIIRTTCINALAQAIESNLSPEKQDYFNISKILVELYINVDGVVRPPLKNYVSIDPNIAILRSNLSEVSTKYEVNCGQQTVPMCLTAVGFNRLKAAKSWTVHDLDEVLDEGDKLYSESMHPDVQGDGESLDEALDQFEGNPEDEGEDDDGGIDLRLFKINSDNAKKSFNLGINRIDIEFEEYDEGNIEEKLQESLQTYFEQENNDPNSNQELLLETDLLNVVMWRDESVYYLFDPKPRDDFGQVIGKEDWSEYIPTPEDMSYLQGLTDMDEEGEDMFETRNLNTEASDFMASGDAHNEDDAASDREVDFELEEEQMGEMGQQEEDEAAVQEVVIHLKKSESYWLQQQRSLGKACTMWFTKLEDLIDHVFESLPPVPRREMNFTLKTIKLENTPIVRERFNPEEDERNTIYDGNWFDFQEFDRGQWILRATMNLDCEMFPKCNRNKQSIPACLAALAFINIYPVRCYKNSSVDRILVYGDKFYTFIRRLKEQQASGLGISKEDIARLLGQEELIDVDDMIVKRICIAKHMINFNIQPDAIIGDINAQNFEEILDVQRGLERFFGNLKEDEKPFGLLQAKNLTVAVWKKSNMFYMFDPNSRGPNGVKSSNGNACITRYLNIEPLTKTFLANLCKFGKNTFRIHRVSLQIDACERKREPIIEPPPIRLPKVGGFANILPGKWIIRGTMHQNDPKFDKKCNALSAPVAVIALTMPLLHKTQTWSKIIINEILMLANELYEESVIQLSYDFNPWEDQMNVYQVKRDYKIGVVNANCEMRQTDQKGIIDIKDPNTNNLRKGIEKFFEENTHGVFISEPLTLALWEEDILHDQTLIYVFDPYPRGPLGMPLLDGAACVMSFVNATVAADHIIGCILDPEKRQSEFTIVPVEIVVGKKKIRFNKKCKEKSVKSFNDTLPSRCSKLVASEEKKKLRKIAEDQRVRKEAKRMYEMGRHNYYTLPTGEAIIRGLRSQTSDNYSEELRGNQDIPNCIVALVMSKLIPLENWTHKHLDLILDTGNQLYIDSYIAYNPKEAKLGLENVMRKFYLNNVAVHVIIYKPIVKAPFTAGHLYRILSSYFQQEQSCMISYKDQWISLIFTGGFLYVFDPHDRDRYGNAVASSLGWAVVMRFDDVHKLALKIIGNLICDFNEEVEEFNLWLMEMCNNDK